LGRKSYQKNPPKKGGKNEKEGVEPALGSQEKPGAPGPLEGTRGHFPKKKGRMGGEGGVFENYAPWGKGKIQAWPVPTAIHVISAKNGHDKRESNKTARIK